MMNFWRNQSAAVAAEYSLILAAAGVGITAGAIVLGGAITTAFNNFVALF